MEAEDQDNFFGTVAAYWRRLNDEEKKGWIRWLDSSDVTLKACLKILESLKEQKDKPRLPQFQFRFLQERNLGKYQYDPGCSRCKDRGKSTGWLRGLYGMKATWEMKYYTGTPIEQRNWNKIWPSVLVDPKDKRDEVIHQYYQLNGLPCSCGLGDRVLEHEIKIDRMPYPKDDHLRISNTMAMTHADAARAITEFQALAVKKYGAEACIAQTFSGFVGAAGGMKALAEVDFFDEEEAPAKFQLRPRKETELVKEFKPPAPGPQPEIPPDPVPVGGKHDSEEGHVEWDNLEITM